MSEPAKASTDMRVGIAKILVVSVVLPQVIYSVCSAQGLSEVLSLSLSGIPPALQSLYDIVRSGKIDIIAVLVVLSIVAGVLVAVLTNDARLLLVKDSFLTLVTGGTFLFSIIFSKENLIMFYNRQFSDKSAADLDVHHANPEVKQATRVMCAAWGLGLVAEAVLRIFLIYALPISTMAYISTWLMVATFVLLGTWSYLYVKHRQGAAAKEAAARANESTRQYGAA
ncbi:hypothetical protein ACHHYP_20267 [Achlya hypogyna]|uniref:Uncharacterized protein n=1 Tax=Achlya hypogyna TaxID=1202772 RepID=A0A1V9YU04_ACHHY|nr:hypothetical protein ACHHYP_20267 [Achlya hypogyna]